MRIINFFPVVVFALFACGLVGCKSEEEADASDTPTVSDTVDRDPVKQFNELFKHFEQEMETDEPGVVTGFTVLQDGARSRFSLETNVSHELFPPKKPTDTYRAEITVTTRSHYSVTLPSEEEAGKESGDKDANESSDEDNQGDRLIQDGLGNDLTTGLFESEPAAGDKSRSRPRPRATEEILSTPPSENVQKIELAYEGGKWVVKTKPEQESMAAALERALRLQY